MKREITKSQRGIRRQIVITGFVLVVLMLMLLMIPSNCLAAWNESGTEVCGNSSEQRHPEITSDGAGGSIIVWEDKRQGDEIYAQKVDAEGNPQWAEDGVLVASSLGDPEHSLGQIKEKIVSDGQGGAIVTWMGAVWDYDHFINHAYAARLNESGEIEWKKRITTADPHGNEVYPQITSDGAGGAFIAWQGSGPVMVRSVVRVQHVNVAGDLMWGEGVSAALKDNPDKPQSNPQIASDGQNGAIITWEYGEIDHSDIYGQRLDSDGAFYWGVYGLMASSGSDSRQPQATSGGGGGGIITWQDIGAGKQIFAAKIPALGGVVDWTLAVSTPGNNRDPRLTGDGSDGAIITWYDEANSAIYSQAVDSSGNAKWIAGPVRCGGGINLEPQIVGDGSGGALITWGFGDTTVQAVNASGDLKWPPDGISAFGGTGTGIRGYAPRIVSTGAGEAIVAWENGHAGDPNVDIYAQKISTSPPPTITSITPTYGVENTEVAITNLAGTGFGSGATVRIEKTGTTVNATDVEVVSATKITCKLNLSGVPLGKYDVVVRNTDAQEAKLTQGFSVTNICGGGAAISLSIFGIMMGLMSLAGSARLKRRWGKAFSP